MGNHYLLIMPDGEYRGCIVPTRKLLIKTLEEFVDSWYKVTRDNPKEYEHIVLEENCPKCGEKLHSKEHKDITNIWCPYCKHQEIRRKKEIMPKID